MIVRRLSLLLSALLALHAVPARAGKTICTITINSDDEKKTFQKHLKPKGFEFVELLPKPDSETEEAPEDGTPTAAPAPGPKEDWFATACRNARKNNLKCDSLIISGHFGGSFFDARRINPDLSTDQLEQESCARTCDGILREPKAVYLFGCNTLAGKNPDRRSAQQYVTDLMADRFTREQAERVAEERYSPIGQSNRDRMLRIFGNSPRIYGFSSIGPSGATVKDFIDNYFKENPDYASTLKSIEAERQEKDQAKLLKKFNEVNNRVKDPFQRCLKNTAICSANGICEEDDDVSALLCSMRNPRAKLADRLLLIQTLLERKDFLAFLPTAANALKDVDPSKLKPAELAIWKEIQGNEKIKSELIGLLDRGPLYQKRYMWTEFSRKLGWVDESEATRLYERLIDDVMKNVEGGMDRADYDLLQSLVGQNPALAEAYAKGFDKRTGAIDKLLEGKDKQTHHLAVRLLRMHPHPESPEVSSRLARILSVRLNGERYNRNVVELAVFAAGQQSTLSPEIRSALVPLLADFQPSSRGFKIQELIPGWRMDSGPERLRDRALDASLKRSGAYGKVLSLLRKSPDDPAVVEAILKMTQTRETNARYLAAAVFLQLPAAKQEAYRKDVERMKGLYLGR